MKMYNIVLCITTLYLCKKYFVLAKYIEKSIFKINFINKVSNKFCNFVFSYINCIVIFIPTL